MQSLSREGKMSAFIADIPSVGLGVFYFLFSPPQSTTDVMFSVAAVNIDCFESGVVCRKSLIIAINQSVIAFDDETGKPVSVTSSLLFFLRK